MPKPKYPSATAEKRPAVAVLGFTDTRELAPFNDPRFEVWGLNELYRYMDIVKLGFTRWFEIHERRVLEPDPEHIKALQRFPIPVYMQQHHEDIGPSVEFPKAQVEKECGRHAVMWEHNGCPYFTSSIAWMLGLALLEGFEEIHLYGVDMATDVEYFEQRASVEYLLGLAQGRGVKIYVPPQADILKSVGQYGWPEQADYRLKIEERAKFLENTRAQLQAKLNNLDNERARCIADINQVLGAINDNNFWKRSWSTPTVSIDGTPHRDREVPIDGKANLKRIENLDEVLK